jgi:nitronate monooxygenase
MLATWLTDRFGLDVPVVSAPMAGVALGRLAGAVSAAGALGTIGYAIGKPEDLKAEAQIAAASGRPFGIGLLAWLLDHQPELLDAALDTRPALISVSFGDYAPYLGRIRDAGVVAVTQVGTVDEAKQAVEAGADIVVARGGEGGGHGRDAVATLPLLQGVLDAVDVPVLAAGGIATARGLAAVLAAGAAGAWVGSAFTACPEGANADSSKSAVVSAAETDTIYTTVLDLGRGAHWPSEYGGRAIRNAFADTWHGREAELESSGTRSDEPAVWVGQAAGLVNSVRPAADIVADLAGAENLLITMWQRCTDLHPPMR